MRPRHQDDVRAKIQASVIIDRLTKCVTGKIAMGPEQVSAARILLAKTLPDLTAVSHSGAVGIQVVLMSASDAKLL